MKKIFFLLLVSNFIYAQNYDYVKSCDTIYIVYKGTEFEGKNSTNLKNNKIYKYYRYNGLPQSDASCWFYYLSVVNDTINKKKVDAKFIDKHKNNTISIDFIRQLKDCRSSEAIFSVDNNPKIVFYIIDFTEEENKKIPIYKVKSMKLCPVKE